MSRFDAVLTLIGGPTVLIEIGGVRLLTDPTFDEPGTYQLPHVTAGEASWPGSCRLGDRPDRCGPAQS